MHCAFASSTGQSISGNMAARNTAADIRQLPKGIPSQDVKIRKIFLKRSSKNNAEAIRAFAPCYSVPRNSRSGNPRIAGLFQCLWQTRNAGTRSNPGIRRTIRPAISSVSSWTLSVAAAFAAVPTISRRARDGGHEEPVIGRAFARPVG
jgi:hypothetical protein